MKRTSLLAVALTTAALSSVAQGQRVTVYRLDFGICAGSALSSFAAWESVAAGNGCESASNSSALDFRANDGLVSDFNGLRIRRETGDGSFRPIILNKLKNQDNNGNKGDNGINGGGEDDDDKSNNGNKNNHGINSSSGNGGNGNNNNGNNGNHGSNNNGNNGNRGNGGIGVSSVDNNLEVLVNETNAAPEPATLLLVASGLGGVGAMMRRRRKAALPGNA